MRLRHLVPFMISRAKGIKADYVEGANDLSASRRYPPMILPDRACSPSFNGAHGQIAAQKLCSPVTIR